MAFSSPTQRDSFWKRSDKQSIRGRNGFRDKKNREFFPRIWALGDVSILQRPLLGCFCSVKCPGELILRTYDLARALRDAAHGLCPCGQALPQPRRLRGVCAACSPSFYAQLKGMRERKLFSQVWSIGPIMDQEPIPLFSLCCQGSGILPA